MRILTPLLLAGLIAAPAALAAEGDASAGQQKAATCAACHGANGVSSNPMWPNLAGQHAGYIQDQLADFKSGLRKNPSMSPMAAPLSEQDMADLGAYFASKPAQIGSADPKLVDAGEKLYRFGNPDSGVAACAACHGPTGIGLDAAGFPAIGGQHSQYVIAQLQAFRAGERGDPKRPQVIMMHGVAKSMTDDEMQAVASYVEGLH